MGMSWKKGTSKRIIMKNFFKQHAAHIIGTLLVIAIVGGLLFGTAKLLWYVSARECAAETQYMGFESRWDRWAGCQIEVSPGQWIPLDSYYFKQE